MSLENLGALTEAKLKTYQLQKPTSKLLHRTCQWNHTSVKISWADVSPGQSALLSLEKILDPELQNLLIELHQTFNQKREQLLQARLERQNRYDQGQLPQYENTNSEAANGQWQVASLPKDLLCRRVEITGPVNDTKMVINMLSRNTEGHRADTAMLDFEDSMKPSWANVLNGLRNIIGVANGDLSFVASGTDGNKEKTYVLNAKDMAFPMVRVRGLHLYENNFLIDGKPIAAGLFDLASCLYHTGKVFLSKGMTPKYYVPKCEHYEEARWWHQLFSTIEKKLAMPHASTRCTFLIETLPAAFQMEEILYELKERIVALNVGRWDKIFSDIKVLKNHADRIAPDRSTITMDRPWMENYAKRLIKICHSRGAMAIGGMSAFTPGKQADVRKEQTTKVLTDKERENRLGHDGCWVSHPYFIGIAMGAFKNQNQLSMTLKEFDKYPDLLLQMTGPTTEKGLRTNLRVGLAYLRGWNRDIGCVAFDNLMEDLATLEISRAQTWQWWHHGVTLDNGKKVTSKLIADLLAEEALKIEQEMKETNDWNASESTDLQRAQNLALEIFTETTLSPFLSTASQKVY